MDTCFRPPSRAGGFLFFVFCFDVHEVILIVGIHTGERGGGGGERTCKSRGEERIYRLSRARRCVEVGVDVGGNKDE